MREMIERYVAAAVRRVRLSIGIGLVRLVNDAGGLQVIQASGLPKQVRDRILRYQGYGFTSVPLEGAQMVLASVGGNQNHLLALAVDDARNRPRNLQPGESALYNHLGDYIRIRNGRFIEVVAGNRVEVTAPEGVFNCSLKVVLNTPLVECAGNMAIAGNLAVGGNVAAAGMVSDLTGSMQAIRVTYNGHVHGGSPTPTPGM